MNSRIKKIRFFAYFITRSFLITILCFMSLIGIVFVLYCGDMLISDSKGIRKNPLFGAYVIVSPSMVPTIEINDAIIVKRLDHDEYKVGDVITFSSEADNYRGKAVTHRIVNKKGYSSSESVYTTKGDNNDTVDQAPVKTNSIYGKVLFKIPAVGKLQNLVSGPINFFISLLIPVSLFVVYDISRIFIMMSKRKV